MNETQLLPVVWILASLTVAVLATLFISPTLITQLRATLGGRLVEQLFRLVYFIGLPYAALLTGSLAPIDLGLTGANGALLGWEAAAWLRGLSTALTLGLVVLLPIGLAGRQIARAAHQGLLGTDDRSAGGVVVEALYSEIHWAFYRAAPLILLDNVYAAALVGVLLVSAEWSVALIRNGLSRAPEDRQRWLRRVLLLALSATVFVMTRNVWLAIGAHGTIELAWKVWLAQLVPHPMRSMPAPIEPAPDPDVRPLR